MAYQFYLFLCSFINIFFCIFIVLHTEILFSFVRSTDTLLTLSELILLICLYSIYLSCVGFFFLEVFHFFCHKRLWQVTHKKSIYTFSTYRLFSFALFLSLLSVVFLFLNWNFGKSIVLKDCTLCTLFIICGMLYYEQKDFIVTQRREKMLSRH